VLPLVRKGVLPLVSTARSVFKMVVEGLTVSCHENFTVLLSFHYFYHTLHHNLNLDSTLSPSIILQCLTQIKMADNIVTKEPLDNPFYVRPLHAKLGIVINILNILQQPSVQTVLNYLNIKNISPPYFRTSVPSSRST